MLISAWKWNGPLPLIVVIYFILPAQLPPENQQAPGGRKKMFVMADLDEPALAELYSYWSERCRGRIAPSRADIDPVDIPHILPHIALTEIVTEPGGGPQRIRVRLAGTQVEKHYGRGLANCFLDELKHGAYLGYIMGLYQGLMATREPLYTEGVFEPTAVTRLRVKRLMLPLSDDGRTVNMVLAGMIYADSDPRRPTIILRCQDHFSQSVLRPS